MNAVDKFYDLIDDCCMLLNEKLHLNYFECLIRVCNDIVYEVNENKLSDDDVLLLQYKYEQLTHVEITNEDVRQAMQLLIIKAMKHISMNLEIMTPDYINYIIAYIINTYYNDKKIIDVLDVEVGTGNLINAISNFVNCDTNLIGVENNKMLIELCKANTEIQNNEISLYFQDVLTVIYDKVDVSVGDLDSVINNDKYYPYEILLNYLNNIKDDGLFIYLIENDFFNQKQINDFKAKFNGTMLGLIVLPHELFNKDHIGKSILIGSPKQFKNLEMMVMQMASINDKDKFYKNITELKQWITKIKEIEK